MSGFIIFLVITLIAWIWWANKAVKRTDIFLRDSRIPQAFCNFKIAHISDFHNTDLGQSNQKLLSMLRGAAPDMIAITGDLVDSRRTDMRIAMDFIRKAADVAPVYYVTGNHESRIEAYMDLEKQMRQAGVNVLRDESALWERDGVFLRIVGLDDQSFTLSRDRWGETAELVEARLKRLIGGERLYTILLSHGPELFGSYQACQADLILCGHAHGGQIRLPLLGGVIAPGQGWFPRFTSGVYEEGCAKMAVSRGIGNSLFPFRINNRPEVVVLTMMNRAQQEEKENVKWKSVKSEGPLK